MIKHFCDLCNKDCTMERVEIEVHENVFGEQRLVVEQINFDKMLELCPNCYRRFNMLKDLHGGLKEDS